MYLGIGWNNKEIDGRWAGNKSSVMFKVIKQGKYLLSFTAKAFYKDMPTSIYIDKKKVTKIIIPLSEKNFSIPVDLTLGEGLHTVHFLFDKSYRPSDLAINIDDKRELSAKFSQISLDKQK